ncbi:hypothetical protein JCM16307_08030 [Thermococcus prieurii]
MGLNVLFSLLIVKYLKLEVVIPMSQHGLQKVREVVGLGQYFRNPADRPRQAEIKAEKR